MNDEALPTEGAASWSDYEHSRPRPVHIIGKRKPGRPRKPKPQKEPQKRGPKKYKHGGIRLPEHYTTLLIVETLIDVRDFPPEKLETWYSSHEWPYRKHPDFETVKYWIKALKRDMDDYREHGRDSLVFQADRELNKQKEDRDKRRAKRERRKTREQNGQLQKQKERQDRIRAQKERQKRTEKLQNAHKT